MRKVVLFSVVLAMSALGGGLSAEQEADGYPDGYITGVVESPQGPEAGVWVIAETSELPTHFTKIVVTDDDGRFVLPQLPEATYDVWVRGYGLVDSEPVTASVGDSVSLRAVLAQTPQEAAEIYPANYWWSLNEIPDRSEFPGTGSDGNGISTEMQHRYQWIDRMKLGCSQCHQIGTKITREITHLRPFDSTVEAWDYRVKVGVRYPSMSERVSAFGRERGLAMLADWTDRIAVGEVPPAPPRPSGAERNVVVTLWDTGGPTAFQHDMVSTDKRNPTVNAFGPVYAATLTEDALDAIDPVRNTDTALGVPVDREALPPRWEGDSPFPSPFWGKELYWADVKANPHSAMIDEQGRVWLTVRARAGENAEWCSDGSRNPFAEYYSLEGRSVTRNAGYYDPATGEWALIDTCLGTHHLQFDFTENNTLYFSGANDAIGWINTKVYDETGSAEDAYGWCPTILDTNGDGRITKPWKAAEGEAGESEGEIEADAAPGAAATLTSQLDIETSAGLDTQVRGGSYGIIVSPVDQSVWVASNSVPGQIVRLDPGDDPPETCVSELYELPVDENGEPEHYGPRGIDVDRDGVIWTALAGSGTVGSFDRRKCAVLNGPTATGQHCPEGWTFYEVPGPSFKGTDVNADFFYYNWVDQFNTLGLGHDVPIAAGSGSDSLLALQPETGEWTVIRVPYPLGFYTRSLDGRIDDPDAGWKGRGLYSNYSTQMRWHTEGGKGTVGKVVRIQLRPDPLAR